MRSVAIGIHVHAQPDRLRATLDSVRTRTGRAVEVVLLPDGPDPETADALRAMRELPQQGTNMPLGAAACFNRLVRVTHADVVILMESGCLVGPGWLERLLAALDADPRHGLAGPSTNMSWNEQSAFPHAGGSGAVIERSSAEAERRFGGTWRTLEPLHSLADFCYVVRREVIDAIGAADERYGLGPCWEMDYNIRAARAGWRGVWACSAFVWRAPFTPRRDREERARMDASRRLYQDKFCALRLRGERPGYEPHCRGEDCEHFAPPAVIEIRRLQAARPAHADVPVPVVVGNAEPLVSCVMPTRDRPDFALQAVRYFQRQDYPERELIILDDGTQDLAPLLPDDPRIRYLRMAPGQTIGGKRNQGAELARGDVIVHWDDDDWYAPARLRTQVEPLLSGQADICGLTTGLFFVLPEWEFWRCTQELHGRLFVHDVHGGTLAFHRRVWTRGARYPGVSLAEDALFLRDAVRHGARLARLPDDDLFIYLRHGVNSWRFACGEHVDPRGWSRAGEPAFLGADRAFYAARCDRAPDPPPALASGGTPHVSCIMPTANRWRFARRAIEYFQRQDYPSRELIIVDDGTEPIEGVLPADPRIRYLRLPARQSLGAKRNLACEAARGELIVHWDDDDWMATDRLTRQVAAMAEHPAVQASGLAALFFYEPATRRAWRYAYERGARPWVAGNTLCYRRTLWQHNAFPAVTEGEDTRFVWSIDPAAVLAMPDPSFFVGIVHAGNTSPKRTTESRWQAAPAERVRGLLGGDVEFYDALSPAPAPAPMPAAPARSATGRVRRG